MTTAHRKPEEAEKMPPAQHSINTSGQSNEETQSARNLTVGKESSRADQEATVKDELQRLFMVISAVASTLDVQELATILLTSVHEILPFDFAGLELLNEDGDTFTYFAPEIYVSTKTKQHYTSIPAPRLSSDPPDSLLSTVFKERRSVFLRETVVEDLPPYQRAHFAITPWKSLLMLPMESMGRIIGCVVLSGKQTFDLDTTQIQSLERYVQQFTFAFVNARQHYQLLRAQNEIGQHLADVEKQKAAFEQAALESEMIELFVRVINREKGFEPLLKTILYQIGYIIPSAEKASVLIYQPETDDFRFLQVVGYNFEEFRPVALSRRDTLERWMAQEHQAAEGIFIVRTFLRSNFETVQAPPVSAMAIRLEVEGELAGLIFLDTFSGTHVFSDDDVRRASALIEHINSAFAKALSLHRLRQQRKQLQDSYNYLGVLSDIAADIASTLDLETVLTSLYHHINRLMDAAYFAIGLYVPQRNVLRFELVIREGRRNEPFEYDMNSDDASKELAVWCVLNRTDVLIPNPRQQDTPQTQYAALLSQNFSVFSGETIHENANQWAEAFVHNTHRSDSKPFSAQSQMYVPLFAKDTVVGVVAVQSPRHKAFTNYHLDILHSIATNAASALLNAEAYTEIKRQQRILEEQAAEIELINSQLVEQNFMLQRSEQLVEEQARSVEEMNSILQETNLTLEQINNEKNELLGIVAHDLKNPLSAIILSVDMLQRFESKMTADEKEKRLQSIRAVSERMNEIIGHLLDINALETGSLRLNIEIVDVAQLAREIVQEYSERAAVKNITLNTTLQMLDGGNNCLVRADARVLREVMENLVSNAIKFSSFDKNVNVRICQALGGIRLEVCDAGPGISREDMTKLFGKFARLSARPTGGEDSTGLGLNIVKKLVEAMKGKVWCESELGNGATFIVELPSAVSEVMQ